MNTIELTAQEFKGAQKMSRHQLMGLAEHDLRYRSDTLWQGLLEAYFPGTKIAQDNTPYHVFCDGLRRFFETVRQSGWALQFASAALKPGKDVVSAAVRQNGMALEYASTALQSDPSLIQTSNIAVLKERRAACDQRYRKGLCSTALSP